MLIDEKKIWACKIGAAIDLPDGADFPMRIAIRDAYVKLTGKEPDFLFSGWGGQLDELEKAAMTWKAEAYED